MISPFLLPTARTITAAERFVCMTVGTSTESLHNSFGWHFSPNHYLSHKKQSIPKSRSSSLECFPQTVTFYLSSDVYLLTFQTWTGLFASYMTWIDGHHTQFFVSNGINWPLGFLIDSFFICTFRTNVGVLRVFGPLSGILRLATVVSSPSVAFQLFPNFDNKRSCNFQEEKNLYIPMPSL